MQHNDQREDLHAAQQADTAAAEPAQNPMQGSIQGYRKFDQATSDFINTVKEEGEIIEVLLARAEKLGADPRALALARTNLQQGAMWLIRSVAKPEGLF